MVRFVRVYTIVTHIHSLLCSFFWLLFLCVFFFLFYFHFIPFNDRASCVSYNGMDGRIVHLYLVYFIPFANSLTHTHNTHPRTCITHLPGTCQSGLRTQFSVRRHFCPRKCVGELWVYKMYINMGFYIALHEFALSSRPTPNWYILTISTIHTHVDMTGINRHKQM